MRSNMVDWNDNNEGSERLGFNLKLSETTLSMLEDEEIGLKLHWHVENIEE